LIFQVVLGKESTAVGLMMCDVIILTLGALVQVPCAALLSGVSPSFTAAEAVADGKALVDKLKGFGSFEMTKLRVSFPARDLNTDVGLHFVFFFTFFEAPSLFNSCHKSHFVIS
jgi:hypothetical protein